MNIIQKPSPNFNDRKGQEITHIILHYTGMKTAQDALEKLCDKTSEVSAHYTIDEAGKIYQHVDEKNRAWHAGDAYWHGKRDINSRSIGIEIVNRGHKHGYHEFPNTQIQSVINLCLQIQERHRIEHVLAHSDIAPMRKEDPGELFPWKKLAENDIGIWPSVADEDFVKSSSMDLMKALQDFGYKAEDSEKMILAFQRHFVPEVFELGREGKPTSLTKARLYALLANHLIS